MAKKARDPVQFTYESAERIASVVRAAELASPAAATLTFGRQIPVQVPRQVRAATFTGSWAVNSSKAVTFASSTAVTATVQNLSWPISHNHASPENCLVGRDGTSWYLVVPVLESATAVAVTQTSQQAVCSQTSVFAAVSGIELSASLNSASCSITIAKTVTTSNVTVVSATSLVTVVSGTQLISFVRPRAV